MNFKTTIGLDVGRSAVKVVANAGGVYFRDLIPSIVSPAIDLADEATANRAELDTVEVGGRKFFTGDTARLQGGASMTVGLSDDWTNSIEYLVLVKSALKRLAARGVTGLDDPYIVLGTPAKLFGAEKERLVARTQQVVAAEMKVIPQPMGAYCSFFQDQRGVPIKERQLDGASSSCSRASTSSGLPTPAKASTTRPNTWCASWPRKASRSPCSRLKKRCAPRRSSTLASATWRPRSRRPSTSSSRRS
jgi:plasmid segregation protein ParM